MILLVVLDRGLGQLLLLGRLVEVQVHYEVLLDSVP